MDTTSLIAPMIEIFKPFVGIMIAIIVIKMIINIIKNSLKWSNSINFWWSNSTNNTVLPYTKKDYFLTISERKFYERLESMITNSQIIVPQVVMSSIVRVNSDKSTFKKRQSKINKKTLDFVIFSKPYFQPILAIEYDGSTHQRVDRIERDSFVDEVLHQSWIKIIHFSHNQWSYESLHWEIQKLL